MQTIRIEADDRGVATLTLSRVDKHNALSAEMIAELTEAASQLANDKRVRVVVLRADGKTFCAGGDLAWMKAQLDATPAERREGALALAHMLKALNDLPKPLIAAVQGNAFGGGIGMMSVCDVAVGVESASFALTETRLGLIPATIGPYVVGRMGGAMARRVFLSGRRFDAEEAVRLGLLSKSVPADELETAVEAEVLPYLSCAPGAVAAAKAHVQALSNPISEDVIAASADALVVQWEGDEVKEGIAAFFDKRPPKWAV